MRSRYASLVAAAAALAFPGSALGHSSHGDANGRIIWSQGGDTNSRIVSADPDGRHFRVLSDPAEGEFDIDPVPSPHGGRILFERDTEDNSVIVLMRADGSGERVLDTGCVDPCADDIAPAWTPDGRHVVFTRVVGPFDLPNDSAHSAVLWSRGPGREAPAAALPAGHRRGLRGLPRTLDPGRADAHLHPRAQRPVQQRRVRDGRGRQARAPAHPMGARRRHIRPVAGELGPHEGR